MAERYNTSGIVTESASGDQLRRLWTNLKTRQRDALTKERQHRLATGGGGPCPDAEIDPDVAEIAPALIVEIPNTIDSDFTGNISEINTQPLSREEPLYEIIQPHQPSTSIQQTNEIQIQPMPSTSTQEINQIQPMPPTSTPETNQVEVHTFPRNQALPSTQDTEDEEIHSNNEKKLRVQILKKEHLNRDRRAQEMHNLQLKQVQESHNLEILILKEKLREAKARADLAEKDLQNTL